MVYLFLFIPLYLPLDYLWHLLIISNNILPPIKDDILYCIFLKVYNPFQIRNIHRDQHSSITGFNIFYFIVVAHGLDSRNSVVTSV